MSDASLFLEIWEIVQEHVNPTKRVDVAISLMEVMRNNELEELGEVVDVDPYLAKAYSEVFADELNSDEDDDEDDF